jgi:hypothetical protein
MRSHALRLHQLAREAKLCTSLCPQISWVNSAHANDYLESECCGAGVLCCVVDLSLPSPAQHTHPHRLWYKIYLQAHPYGQNQRSYVEILHSSYIVPTTLSTKILNY